jgi:C4-dicarboxylate-specific signal transduction histidine kinase
MLRFASEDLREVLEEAATLAIGKRRRDEAATIELSVPAGLAVEVSRSRFVQALTNVLENAIESYEGLERLAAVVVSAHSANGLVTIVIEDRGCGMSAEAKDDATTLFATSKKNGTGFGLPLAVKIVEAEHGGRLHIESAPDEGTTVRMTVRVLR